MKAKRILSLALAFLLALSVVPFCFTASAEDLVFYVKEGGTGTKDGNSAANAFATIAEAVAKAGTNDAKIVIVGAYNWTSNPNKAKHTGMITYTGADSSALLTVDPSKSVIFCGPSTLVDIGLNIGLNAHLNSGGYKIVFGKGVEMKTGTIYHDGPLGSGILNRTETIIDGGIIQTYCFGGAYVTKIDTNGVAGNMNLTLNSGEIKVLIMSPDGYGPVTQHSGITVGGNVCISINGGKIDKVTQTPSRPLQINGSFQVIYNNDMKEIEGLTPPSTFTGASYVVKSGANGMIYHTDKAGQFRVAAKEGYVAQVGGKPVYNGITTFSKGTTTVTYIPGEQPAPQIVINKEANFITGYTDKTFKPNNNMTRAEAATVVRRLFATDDEVKGQTATKFTDVKTTDWFFDTIACLESFDILSSYSGEFKPNQNITRAEFVELLYKVGKLKAEGTISFTDVPKTHKMYDAIVAAASAKLVNGYPDGTFKPDGQITRAEVVKVVVSFLGKTVPTSGSTTVFSDISDHWAKYYIVAAAGK